ncbi:MAG: SIR2 family protein [Victivallaceae bacterium]|nr:SIR2 family protein [Victivallaceae bacterium]
MRTDKIKNIIQDSNINFLIGSGLSAPYLSILGNIEKLLSDLNEDTSLGLKQKALIKASIYNKFYNSVIEKNINILNNARGTSQVLRRYENFFSTINKLLLIRRNKLKSKQVNIFTTNVDICMEKSLEAKGFEYNDGFSGRFQPKYDISNFKKSILKRSLHYENSSEIPIFNILKLHGSLTWTREPDEGNNNIFCDIPLTQVKKVKTSKDRFSGVFMNIDDNEDILNTIVEKLPASIGEDDFNDFIDEYNKLAIVNPTKDKFRDTLLNQTYYDLLRIYSNELEKENTLLFVMGFSFADEHIKELTLRVANSNPTLLIIIIAYSKEAALTIKKNIDMSKLRNSNIEFITPKIITDDDGNEKDEFEYNLNRINSKIFGPILKKVEAANE